MPSSTPNGVPLMSATNVPLPAVQSVKPGPVQGPPPAIRRPLGIWADGVILGGAAPEVRCTVAVAIQVVLSLGNPGEVSVREKLASTAERAAVDDSVES